MLASQREDQATAAYTSVWYGSRSGFRKSGRARYGAPRPLRTTRISLSDSSVVPGEGT
jgi:hypothetical protein